MTKKLFFILIFLLFSSKTHATTNENIKVLINKYYYAIQSKDINWIKNNSIGLDNKKLKIFKAVFQSID